MNTQWGTVLKSESKFYFLNEVEYLKRKKGSWFGMFCFLFSEQNAYCVLGKFALNISLKTQDMISKLMVLTSY